MKFFASLALALALAVLVLSAAPLRAEKPATTDSKEAATNQKKDKTATKDKDAGEAAFDIPIQEGVPVRGIKIPNYDKNGKLQMMFDAEVARKVDANHVEMENLKIEAYSDDGKKFYIELPRAVFNLETRIMDGQSHVLIRREDFEITGEQGTFNVKTRNAKILGTIKMTIFSTEGFDTP